MSEALFYKRQINLKELGIEGQEKLKNISLLIVGAGGLGHPAAMYLAGAGIGKIGICDDDKVDLTNLHRQVLFNPEDVGNSKAEVLSSRINKQNPYINITTHNLRLNKGNKQILNEYDLILDCTDNFETKFLIHDFCYLNKKDLIQASIYKFEGNLNTFKFKTNLNTPCLRCLWPKIPGKDSVGGCADVGVIGSIAGLFGTLQASEAIKLILGMDTLEQGENYTFDLRTMNQCKLKWRRNPECPLCSTNSEVQEVNNDFEVRNKSGIIDPIEIKVEEDFNIDDFIYQIDLDKNYLFYCSRGIKSYRVVKYLRAQNYINCYSLSDKI